MASLIVYLPASTDVYWWQYEFNLVIPLYFGGRRGAGHDTKRRERDSFLYTRTVDRVLSLVVKGLPRNLFSWGRCSVPKGAFPTWEGGECGGREQGSAKESREILEEGYKGTLSLGVRPRRGRGGAPRWREYEWRVYMENEGECYEGPLIFLWPRFWAAVLSQSH